jgi:hypothetical protein
MGFIQGCVPSQRKVLWVWVESFARATYEKSVCCNSQCHGPHMLSEQDRSEDKPDGVLQRAKRIEDHEVSVPK